jgi:hypothetical protein
MLLLLIAFAAGAVCLSAAILVFPYRIRFLRRADRVAFLVSTTVSGAVGAALASTAGALLCVSLIPL